MKPFINKTIKENNISINENSQCSSIFLKQGRGGGPLSHLKGVPEEGNLAYLPEGI